MLLINGGSQEAAAVAERTWSAIEEERSPERDASIWRRITVSLGAAPLGEATGSLNELAEAADEEMYHAKRADKNRVSIPQVPRP